MPTGYHHKEVVSETGTTLYLNKNDQLHRTDGPAIEYGNGDKTWWVDGKLHRTDGPAVVWSNGDKEWFVDGKRHRTDGPAIDYADGYKVWYVNEVELSEEEFNLRYNPKPIELPKVKSKNKF